MRLEGRTLRRLAQEHAFQAPRLEKVIRLTGFLAEVARHHDLGDHLRLKGGTALDVYHLDVPRLSVDADLNLQQDLDARDLPRRRNEVERHLESIAEAQGYAMERIQDTHALRGYVLRYQGTLGNQDHIKLDVNFLERIPVLPPTRLAPPEWLPVPDIEVPVLALDELAGSKVATLMLRGAARDLFDVAQFPDLDLDHDRVRRIALFYGFLADLDLASMDSDRLDQITTAQCAVTSWTFFPSAPPTRPCDPARPLTPCATGPVPS